MFNPKDVSTKSKKFDTVSETDTTNNSSLDNVELPEIVKADSIEWPETMRRIGKYAKYDNIQVDEAITGLPKKLVETIRGRLKKRGYKMLSCQMPDGTFALRRIAGEYEPKAKESSAA